jgi:hypothetical protein
MEQQRTLTTKERKELRRKERIVYQKRGTRQKSFRRLAMYTVITLFLGAGSYGLYYFAQTSGREGPDFSRAVPVMTDINHIPEGWSWFVQYNSNPPTSGPHYDQTARSGFREVEISDGHIVHNLEHGDVWISYHPRVSDEVKEQLKQFAHPKVIITPRQKNDTDIALAAWGRLDKFDLEDGTVPVQRIRDFIRRYMHRGPEQVPGASGGV